MYINPLIINNNIFLFPRLTSSLSSLKMARPKITLYLDTVSPFAYEAYYILRVS